MIFFLLYRKIEGGYEEGEGSDSSESDDEEMFAKVSRLHGDTDEHIEFSPDDFDEDSQEAKIWKEAGEAFGPNMIGQYPPLSSKLSDTSNTEDVGTVQGHMDTDNADCNVGDNDGDMDTLDHDNSNKFSNNSSGTGEKSKVATEDMDSKDTLNNSNSEGSKSLHTDDKKLENLEF